MIWKPSKIVGAILGVFATLPLSVWGFVIGGDFIGAWTSGWLTIPGALFGAGLVIFAGAFLGSTAAGRLDRRRPGCRTLRRANVGHLLRQGSRDHALQLDADHGRSERDPHRPYTVEVFNMTRAEITDPRIEPLDVVAIEGVVAAAYRQMCDAAWQAYRTDKIVYFYYIVRELLKELENHWKDSRKLPDSSDVARLSAEFAALMEQARTAKAEKTEGKGLKSGKRP